MKTMSKLLSFAVLLPLLSACLIVEDYGETWDNAQYDPCLLPIAKRITEWSLPTEEEGAEEQLRWVSLGNHYGLMLIKEAEGESGGHAYLYRMDGKVITAFTPDQSKRALFENEYPDAPVAIDEDTLTIASLNEDVLSFIAELAQKEEYWRAEDGRLYNTARNEACPQYVYTEDD